MSDQDHKASTAAIIKDAKALTRSLDLLLSNMRPDLEKCWGLFDKAVDFLEANQSILVHASYHPAQTLPRPDIDSVVVNMCQSLGDNAYALLEISNAKILGKTNSSPKDVQDVMRTFEAIFSGLTRALPQAILDDRDCRKKILPRPLANFLHEAFFLKPQSAVSSLPPDQQEQIARELTRMVNQFAPVLSRGPHQFTLSLHLSSAVRHCELAPSVFSQTLVDSAVHVWLGKAPQHEEVLSIMDQINKTPKAFLPQTKKALHEHIHTDAIFTESVSRHHFSTAEKIVDHIDPSVVTQSIHDLINEMLSSSPKIKAIWEKSLLENAVENTQVSKTSKPQSKI